MKKCTKIIALASLAVLSFSCGGQNQPKNNTAAPAPKSTFNPLEVDPYFVETLGTTSLSGPKSITRNIHQAQNGDIWLASWEGIIRYDGKAFTNFTNLAGLRRWHVFSVLEDRLGNLWFGTIGAGIYRFDGKTFVNFTQNDGLANDKVTCMAEDRLGNLWFGASRFDGKSLTNFTESDGLASTDINSVLEGKDGKIWFGTWKGVSVFDGSVFTDFKKENGEPFSNVRSIIQDKSGKIWIGGNDGICNFDGTSMQWVSKNFGGYLFEDSRENIWASSRNPEEPNMALFRLDAASMSAGKANLLKVKALEQFKVGQYFGITEDKAGHIWLGTDIGVGRFDGERVTFFRE